MIHTWDAAGFAYTFRIYHDKTSSFTNEDDFPFYSGFVLYCVNVVCYYCRSDDWLWNWVEYKLQAKQIAMIRGDEKRQNKISNTSTSTFSDVVVGMGVSINALASCRVRSKYKTCRQFFVLCGMALSGCHMVRYVVLNQSGCKCGIIRFISYNLGVARYSIWWFDNFWNRVIVKIVFGVYRLRAVWYDTGSGLW